jgi:hypothetical protein
MAKFVIYDSDHHPDLVRGDIIHCGDDDMHFGKEELSSPRLCCIEVPDMPYEEGKNKANSFQHSFADQGYIPRPNRLFVDLDVLLGVDRNGQGRHVVNKAKINAHTKSRSEPNPDFKG